MSLLVSNTQVIDRYPITGSIGPWNRDASIITNASQYSPLGATTAAAEVQLSKFRSSAVKVLPAQPVILPDQEFIVNVQTPALAAALPTAGTTYLQLTLEGFGTLFAPNGTL